MDQAKGKSHIRYIKERAWDIWKEAGWQTGMRDECLRQALKEHVDELIKSGDNPPVEAPPPIKNKKCGNKINLDGEILVGNIFRARGWDECKKNYRDFTLGIEQKSKTMHGPQISYGLLYNIPDREFRHNVDLLYFYNWEHVYLGGGAAALFSKDKLYDVGPKISAGLRFYIK